MTRYDLITHVSSMLDTHDGHTPNDLAIITALMACKQDVDGAIPNMSVQLEATALNGCPEFLLVYSDDSTAPMFTGTLAVFRPAFDVKHPRNLWVREQPPRSYSHATRLLERSRYWLLMLRNVRDELAVGPVVHGAATLRESND